MGVQILWRKANVCRDMIDDAAKLGYGEYRTHLALMDQVAATYDFNDGALMKWAYIHLVTEYG